MTKKSFQLNLSYHYERSQPLSDIVGNSEAVVYLTSERPHKVYVSIMTSRGLTFMEQVQVDEKPFKIPYNAPWGRDWSVLQLQASSPRSIQEEPYEVTLVVEKY
jgi:hypothetical protein